MEDLNPPAYNEEALEYLVDANNELRENNSILNAIIDALHENIDSLHQQLGIDDDSVKPRSPRCSICGSDLHNNKVQARHMSFHRYEINEARKNNGLQPYNLALAPAAHEASVVVSREQKKQSQSRSRLCNVMTRRAAFSPEPSSPPFSGTIRVSRRERRVSEEVDGFANNTSPPRITPARERKGKLAKNRVLVKAKKMPALVRRSARSESVVKRKR